MCLSEVLLLLITTQVIIIHDIDDDSSNLLLQSLLSLNCLIFYFVKREPISGQLRDLSKITQLSSNEVGIKTQSTLFPLCISLLGGKPDRNLAGRMIKEDGPSRKANSTTWARPPSLCQLDTA